MLKSPTTMQWRDLGAGNKPKPNLDNARRGILAMHILCRHDQFRDVTTIGYIGDQNVHEIKPMEGKVVPLGVV
jgi:hypothetical protein